MKHVDAVVIGDAEPTKEEPMRNQCWAVVLLFACGFSFGCAVGVSEAELTDAIEAFLADNHTACLGTLGNEDSLVQAGMMEKKIEVVNAPEMPWDPTADQKPNKKTKVTYVLTEKGESFNKKNFLGDCLIFGESRIQIKDFTEPVRPGKVYSDVKFEYWAEVTKNWIEHPALQKTASRHENLVARRLEGQLRVHPTNNGWKVDENFMGTLARVPRGLE